MKKILIVEDELAYLKLLSEQLAKQSYEVVSAPNGAEGLAKAEKLKPDLILLDIRMPKMDGLTMLHQLRSDEQSSGSGRRAKVVVLTNLEPDEAIIHRVITDHPDYYFVKSDTKLEDLLKKIAELLAQ